MNKGEPIYGTSERFYRADEPVEDVPFLTRRLAPTGRQDAEWLEPEPWGPLRQTGIHYD